MQHTAKQPGPDHVRGHHHLGIADPPEGRGAQGRPPTRRRPGCLRPERAASTWMRPQSGPEEQERRPRAWA